MRKISPLWLWTLPVIASVGVNYFFNYTDLGVSLRLRQETLIQERTIEARSFAVHDKRWGDGIEPLTDQEWAACKSYIGHKYWYGGGFQSYCKARRNVGG